MILPDNSHTGLDNHNVNIFSLRFNMNAINSMDFLIQSEALVHVIRNDWNPTSNTKMDSGLKKARNSKKDNTHQKKL